MEEMRPLAPLLLLTGLARAALIPPPHQVTHPGGGSLDLSRGCRIVAVGAADPRPGEWLEDQLRALGLAPAGGAAVVTLRLGNGSSTGCEAQGYRLTVSSHGVEISAPTSEGLFHGAVTLVQLLGESPASQALAPVGIEDRPDLALRGITIDFRYAHLTNAHLHRIIDRAATRQANLLVWWLQREFA